MYHVIVNGSHANGNIAEKMNTVKGAFERAGKEVVFHVTEHTGHAREIVQSLTEGGEFTHLIAMGGDGTLHEVLNGIKDVKNCTLGLIPLGSGNDFAEAMRLPLNVLEAAQLIAFRAPSPIDFIELESGLRSINAVGMGIDVDVLQRAYTGKKTGKKKYFSAFLKSLRHYKAVPFKASWDDGEERVYTGMIACLGNGKQIGGGIKLFPEAVIDDGYMDLLVVNYISRVKTLFAFIKLATGRVNKIKEVTHVKCKSARLTPVSGDSQPIQAEGEIYDSIPLNAHIVEGELKFYLPNYN